MVRWLLEHLRWTHSPPLVAFTAACIWSTNTFINFQARVWSLAHFYKVVHNFHFYV
jgi:hypothetical protein